MSNTRPASVSDYLSSLPRDKRAVMQTVRDTVVRNLPKGYREAMASGFITYEVPFEQLPNTYNGHPLWYAALASQKNYFTLHLMSVYGSPDRTGRLQEEFAKRGKKLDMGKACVRFKSLDDLPLDVIGDVIAATPLEDFVAAYHASRAKTKSGARKAPRRTAARTGRR
jgi:uncharacterized protein DUF1801